MLAAVYVGAEFTSLFFQFSDAREREYLKSAAVGKDGAFPSVEPVQAACRTQHIQTGPEVEVVCVAQDNLCLHLLAQFLEVHPLYGTCRSYGHEDRGLDLSVVGGDDACTRITCLIRCL